MRKFYNENFVAIVIIIFYMAVIAGMLYLHNK